MEDIVWLFDFDGVLRGQDFYRGRAHRWIPTGDIPGVHGYCGPAAGRLLQERVAGVQEPTLCFLGSGNHHYAALFLARKLREDFTLVLFDRHSDLFPPAFGSLLSCGNWVREAARLRFLRQIVLAGVAEPERIPAACVPAGKGLTVFSAETVAGGADWAESLGEAVRYPAYVSVDKDVFAGDVAFTNWGQGRLRMDGFARALRAVAARQRLLGMDVCGEFPGIYGDPCVGEAANRRNDAANRALLELWESRTA